MKKLIISIVILVFFSACDNKPNLGGFWYKAYHLENGNPIQNYSESVFMSINNDSVIMMSDRLYRPLEIERNGFEISESGLAIGATEYSYLFKGDSILLVLKEDSTFQSVFKRLKGPKFKGGIDDMFKGSFEVWADQNHLIQSIDFLSDSILYVEDSPFCSGSQKVRWYSYKFNDYTFFRSAAICKLFLINTSENDSIIMSNPTFFGEKIYFEKVDSIFSRKNSVE